MPQHKRRLQNENVYTATTETKPAHSIKKEGQVRDDKVEGNEWGNIRIFYGICSPPT